jgi:hypothetical protein
VQNFVNISFDCFFGGGVVRFFLGDVFGTGGLMTGTGLGFGFTTATGFGFGGVVSLTKTTYLT